MGEVNPNTVGKHDDPALCSMRRSMRTEWRLTSRCPWWGSTRH